MSAGEIKDAFGFANLISKYCIKEKKHY